jgi:hypothetical protein
VRSDQKRKQRCDNDVAAGWGAGGTLTYPLTQPPFATRFARSSQTGAHLRAHIRQAQGHRPPAARPHKLLHPPPAIPFEVAPTPLRPRGENGPK